MPSSFHILHRLEARSKPNPHFEDQLDASAQIKPWTPLFHQSFSSFTPRISFFSTFLWSVSFGRFYLYYRRYSCELWRCIPLSCSCNPVMVCMNLSQSKPMSSYPRFNAWWIEMVRFHWNAQIYRHDQASYLVAVISVSLEVQIREVYSRICELLFASWCQILLFPFLTRDPN